MSQHLLGFFLFVFVMSCSPSNTAISKVDIEKSLLFIAGGPLEDECNAVRFGRDNNILFIGRISKGTAVGSGNICTDTTCAFVAKLDPSGTILWTRILPFTRGSGDGLAVGKNNNIFVIGSSSKGPFLVKVSPKGELLWAKIMDSISVIRSLALDKKNALVLLGEFVKSGRINNSTFSAVSEGKDIFVAKLTDNGVTLWVQVMGGVKSDRAIQVATNSQNQIYFIGQFEDTIKIGSLHLPFEGGGTREAIPFLAKLDQNGNALFAKALANQGAVYNYDIHMSFAIASNDDVILAFLTSGIVGFNDSRERADVLRLMKIDTKNKTLWGKRSLNAVGFISAMTFDSQKNVYLVGSFSPWPLPGPFFRDGAVLEDKEGLLFLMKVDNKGRFVWMHLIDTHAVSDKNYDVAWVKNTVVVAGSFAGPFRFRDQTKLSKGYNDIFILLLQLMEEGEK